MLGVGPFPPPSAPPQLLNRTATLTTTPSFSLLRHNQILKLVRTGFSLFAQNEVQSSSIGTTTLVKEANFNDEKDDILDINDDNNDGDDDNDDDDDDDNDVDDVDYDDWFKEMRELLERKPRGFGEGKVYDTSVEDKIMEEVKSDMKAKLVNVNKLKNELKKIETDMRAKLTTLNMLKKTLKGSTLEKEVKKELEASEGASSMIRVRVYSLPKKTRILRDLESAFAGAPGIANISPALTKNKQTKLRYCRGYAFVDFKSIEDANRFVNTFSGQELTFGKVKKQIKCEFLKPCDAGLEGSTGGQHESFSESRSIVAEDEGADENFSKEDEDFDESDGESNNANVVDVPNLLGLSESHDSDDTTKDEVDS